MRAAIVSHGNEIGRASLAAAIRTRWPAFNLREFDSIASLLNAITSNDGDTWFPDLGVVSQSWPDEFSRGDVLRLMSASPLTRWVCSYGPWCDSDGRNRDIWPAAFRVSSTWADVRLDREADVLTNNLTPLSPTASPAEIFRFHFRRARPAIAPRRIVVISPDRAYRRSLAQLLEDCGHTVVDQFAPVATGLHPARGECDVILWDCDPWETSQREWLQRLDATAVPIVGLFGLPLPGDQCPFSELGIRATVAKLAPVEKLLATIGDVTPTSHVRQISPLPPSLDRGHG